MVAKLASLPCFEAFGVIECPDSEKKKPRVHKTFACSSGAGNGCANFMGAWNFVLSAGERPPCPQKSSFWVGGVFCFFFWGGGSANFSFIGARILLNLSCETKTLLFRLVAQQFACTTNFDSRESISAHSCAKKSSSDFL